ncbi:hypothetical protein PIB30_073441 [Stylosanthes scabra]|uniref:Uncharacterized protein n=1 Tax=Stylosanthes scabra TaxID=79078 RepID=A0ABU6VRY7_9FABA|nr:hypothetical protein [Stylosanthes scabra]
MRRGRRELRVAVNRASIGALDQKLWRPEVGASGERIDSNQFLNQFSTNSLSFLVPEAKLIQTFPATSYPSFTAASRLHAADELGESGGNQKTSSKPPRGRIHPRDQVPHMA